MRLVNALQYVVRHPLNRGREVQAAGRFISWQLRSRLNPKTRRFNYVEDLHLNVAPGETGVTGNLYCGLHEYEGMGFTLHFLRPGDLFLDVGANAGTYSVLAAATGADVIAFEPGEALERLRGNVALNGLKVDVRAMAVGDRCGQAFFTAGLDVCNSLAAEGTGVAVEMTSLDALKVSPALMKIDVETFEATVLRGAKNTLPKTQAVIIESADECHDILRGAGFAPVDYDPRSRMVTRMDGPRPGIVNTLYVRDFAAASERVKSSKPYRIAGRTTL
jgi:FkbM family methyltransferase